MEKLHRNYNLRIDTKDGKTVEVTLPFTVEFNIVRNILSSASTSSIRVFNLSESTRNSIYKDKNDFGKYRAIHLKAGYGDTLSTIFKGNVSHSFSVREGVNFISSLEAYDAGFAFLNSQVNKSYPSGTTSRSVFEDMMKTMEPTVKVGAIGAIDGSLSRGASYSGCAKDLLTELTGGKFFVDNEKAYVLSDSECIRGVIGEVNSDTGLLGTPVREETIINFDMIFEPRLMIGQLLRLNSSTGQKSWNGDYKVISIKHRGMISPTLGGQAITSVGMWHGPKMTVIN